MHWVRRSFLSSVVLAAAAAQPALAQAPVAWLRYAIPPDPPRYHDMPHAVVVLGDTNGQPAPEEAEAADELDRGLGHMVAGTDILLHRFDPRLDAIVLGTTDTLHRARLGRSLPGWTEKSLPEEGFRIVHLRRGIRHWWILQGGSPRAELWAAYRFAALVAEDQQLPDELVESPTISNRMLILDWREGRMAGDARETARMMASTGMNGLAVRGATSTEALEKLSRQMRSFGIRVWLENNAGARTLTPVSGPAATFGEIREAVIARFPMSGLASPDFGRDGSQSQAAEFALAPGGVRMPVLPLEAWRRALHTPERNTGTLLEAVKSGAVLGRLEPQAADALAHDPLLQANLYAFGRMAWNPTLPADKVIDEWARQSWGDDARIFAVAKKIVLDSAASYTALVSPMGLSPLLDQHGEGPQMTAAKPLADTSGIGQDRTADLAEYPEAFAAELSDPERCPEEWLLALHRMPYSFHLRSGKTLAQGFYDAHFAGASLATNAVDAWEETRELVDPARYAEFHSILEEAARRAEIWREATTEWLARVSGIPDGSGFVGSHTGRIEAEVMESIRYASQRTAEPEDASDSAFSVCHAAECAIGTRFHGEEDVYRVEIGYFDERTGDSTFEFRLNGKVRARWNNVTRGGEPGGTTAERFTLNGVRLKPNDHLEIRAVPHDGAQASVDFVEITRDPRWN